MRDDAANILVYIALGSVLLGLLVLGGFYLVEGEAYNFEMCLETNKEAGFYPYNPPRHSVDENF